jgi:uncharacterized protein HemX
VPPAQQYFLRENLKLRLLSARFDLLFRDQANFRAILVADAWRQIFRYALEAGRRCRRF